MKGLGHQGLGISVRAGTAVGRVRCDMDMCSTCSTFSFGTLQGRNDIWGSRARDPPKGTVGRGWPAEEVNRKASFLWKCPNIPTSTQKKTTKGMLAARGTQDLVIQQAFPKLPLLLLYEICFDSDRSHAK